MPWIDIDFYTLFLKHSRGIVTIPTVHQLNIKLRRHTNKLSISQIPLKTNYELKTFIECFEIFWACKIFSQKENDPFAEKVVENAQLSQQISDKEHCVLYYQCDIKSDARSVPLPRKYIQF